jgi:flagellar basal-body rod protein FlgG
MLNGMIDSVRGCLKEEIRMDIISNNLANSTVIGFKKDKVAFKDLLNQTVQSAGSNLQPTENKEKDYALLSIRCDMGQGDFRSTGNPWDLAISGRGFFKIETPDGIRFTRKGNFKSDMLGRVITQEGHLVLGKSGPINVPPSTRVIAVNHQGMISADNINVGQVDLVDFENYDHLAKEGSGYFINVFDDPGESPPVETGIKQGYLELANVDVSEEMVQMIHCMRAFESYQKAIKVLDGLDNRAVNEVSRLR